jgi:hypothetical protein
MTRALILLMLASQLVHAQAGRGRPPAGPPPPARAAAPFDITGYWTSMITQNWRLRIVTPPKGDYLGIPLTAAAKKIADAWDPGKDEASGDLCKGYGAAAIMNLPERLHITWVDDDTLRMDIDAGTQTRVFHFGNWKSTGVEPSRQGDTAAAWIARRGAEITPSTPQSRYLKTTTTHMLAGYLRKNGVPYSENATLTEYFDLIPQGERDAMLIVSSIVEDPLYLDDPLILVEQFKKQADAAGWNPSPCIVK